VLGEGAKPINDILDAHLSFPPNDKEEFCLAKGIAQTNTLLIVNKAHYYINQIDGGPLGQWFVRMDNR
jgi:hypothetical protein